MELGGWCFFGGGCELGGSVPLGAQIYRALTALEPPGVFSEAEESIRAIHRRAVAAACGEHAQTVLDNLEREIFPTRAETLMPEWEALFELVAAGGATLEERRAAVLARWRGGEGATVPELRRVLASLLNPGTAFRDTFHGDALGWRWFRSAGVGSIVVVDGIATFAIAASEDGDWDDEGIRGPHALVPLVDRDDEVRLEAKIDAATLGTASAGGIVLWESARDAWMLSIVEDGGNVYPQLDRIEDGVVHRNVARGDVVGAYPYYLRLRRAGEWVSAFAGTDDTALAWIADAKLGSIRPRKVGLYCRSDATEQGAASIDLDWLRFAHGRAENNVEVIETTADIVPVGAPGHAFFAFVHREPLLDAGSYDLKAAQRVCDRLKLGHCLILVGESDCVLGDDAYSLGDRDVAGF